MFKDLLGQHKVKEVFQKFILSKDVPNAVFFGPSGCGKTTFVRLLAKELGGEFYEFDGASFSVEKVRSLLKPGLFKPIVFVDEVHRLSRTQQEAFLKPLEEGGFYFFAASTQNPIFMLEKALRSRLLFFEFEKLSDEIFLEFLKNHNLDDECKKLLILASNGDFRVLQNLLKNAYKLSKAPSVDDIKALSKNLCYVDNSHYELISALIKSMRGSDTDAALLYLARYLISNGDAVFVARRLVIFASEDVGGANPSALNLAVSTMQGVEKIGMPEARILLSQCVVYLCKSPKSNASYNAINKALDYVKSSPQEPIPPYLINTHEEKKHYIYPHDFPNKKQIYAPNCPKFYEDYQIGFEKNFTFWKDNLYKKD